MRGLGYDYLSKIAMCKVFVNDLKSGSVFLFSDNSKMYALTAYHCLYDDDDEIYERIYIGYDSNHQFNYSILYSDKNTDIVLLNINPNTFIDSNELCNIQNGVKLNSRNNYCIIGYPCNISENGLIELDVNYKHKADDSINEFELVRNEEHNKLLGFSGGIVCEKIDEDYYFCGIISRALSDNFEYGYIKCLSYSAINIALRNIDFSISEIPECCYKYKSNFYEKLSLVRDRVEFSNKWVDSDTATSIKSTIKEFYEGKNHVLTFIGLSGIGKTRSVLKACEDLCLDSTIYYDDIEKFKEDSNSNWLNHNNLTVIIDEVKYGEWEYIYNRYAHVLYKIIIIATIPFESIDIYENQIDFHSLKVITEIEIRAVIKAQYPVIRDQEIEIIESFCHLDLRLALLIAELYNRDNKICSPRNSSKTLVSNYNSAENILKKALSVYGEQTEKLSKIYQELSTIVDVGCRGAAKKECEALANYFDRDVNDYLYGIETFTSNNLGYQNDYYFRAMPLALSKLAFEKNIWPDLKYHISEFISNLPNANAIRRFYDRIYECEINDKEVSGAFAPYFHIRFESLVVSEVFEHYSDEISLYIEYNPNVGLKWLENALYSDPNINKFRYHRQSVVLLCEKLACFKQYFEVCERILFFLAKNETDHVYSNNSQGVWADLFGVFGANTDLPFNIRRDILFQHIEKDITSSCLNPELLCKAISRIFAKQIFKPVLPKVIGKQLTPSCWNPKNVNESINCEKDVLIRLKNLSSSFSDKFKDLLLDSLLTFVYDFVCEGIYQTAFELIDSLITDSNSKLKVISKVQFLLEIPEIKNCEDTSLIEYLEEVLFKYKDQSVLGKLYEYLHTDVWTYHKGPDYYIILAKKLASDLYFSEISIDDYLLYFADSDCKTMALETLSFELAKLDSSRKLLNSVIHNGKEYLIFVKGYINSLAESNENESVIQYILDSCIEISPDFVINNTVIFDISESGYNRIVNCIHESVRLQSNLGYYIVRWFLMDDTTGINLLTKLSMASKEMKYYLIFSCGQHLSFSYKSNNRIISNDVYSFFIAQLKACFLENGNYDAFDLINTFKYVSEELVLDVFSNLINYFTFGEINSAVNYEIIEFLKLRIKPQNSSVLMNLFGMKLLESERKIILGPAYVGFFDCFPTETVLKWIDEDSLQRAPLIAYHLSYPTLENDSFSELSRSVLEKYSSVPNVLKEFKKGNYNCKVVNISQIYNDKEKYLNLYKKYVDDDYPISEWANYCINYVNETCDNMDEREKIEKRTDD